MGRGEGSDSGEHVLPRQFTGEGLDAWDTSAVTNLDSTFEGANSMDADLGKWDVAKVKNLEDTFYSASKFHGVGLDSWITSAVTSLHGTFESAISMNFDLGPWDVSKVKTLDKTFKGAAKYAGKGLNLWEIRAVTTLKETFSGTSSLTSCNKRLIADAWTNRSSAVFTATTYDTDWAGAKCTSCSAAGNKLNALSGGCVLCSPGRFALDNNALETCEPCGVGNYSDAAGSSDCKQCVAGKYNNQLAQAVCVSCTAAGAQKYQSEIGQESCDTCSAGLKPTNIADACTCVDPCPKGK